MTSEVVLHGVGDLIPDWPEPEFLFQPIVPTLKQADIRFGQLECVPSEKGEPQLNMLPVRKVDPARASGLKYAGFDVISLAGNHHLDRGVEAFYETIEVLGNNGIKVVGVGRNIHEARQPVVVERNGTKIAFLACCSVLPKHYEATAERPGCVPMRVSTYYEQIDWQPGTPPRIVTVPNEEDLAALLEDIRKAKQAADVVVLSAHWGTHFVPAEISMYQRKVAHAAIDAGVDLILGHHPHILKGIEVYRGKAIFYSLCNFVLPNVPGRRTAFKQMYNHTPPVDPTRKYPEYYFHPDSRKTMIAKCVITDKAISRVSFIPLMVNEYAQPLAVTNGDKDFDDVLAYTKDISDSQKLPVTFTVDGNEVVITQ